MGCARTLIDTATDQPTGFICGPGIVPCTECGQIALHLCDFPMGKGKTCDAALCCQHAHLIGPDRDLCPIHYAMFRATGAEAPIKLKQIELFQGAE